MIFWFRFIFSSISLRSINSNSSFHRFWTGCNYLYQKSSGLRLEESAVPPLITIGVFVKITAINYSEKSAFMQMFHVEQ
ncbi:hypothetical protein ANHS_1056 [Ligilactobacillus ruminis ATCC 25644]|nr:hypothetical protein ANHS_1056 [Ligilactobacillus ruminis ATCC 25644]